MQRVRGQLRWAVVVVVLGMSFGFTGVVSKALAQSDTMKKDDMKKEERDKGDKMMKKGDEKKMMKSDDKMMMKKDDTMMKGDKAMEKKQ